jgi:sugar lactone lactonase YvrE
MITSLRWALSALVLVGCSAPPAPDRRPAEPALEVVWESPDRQLTGVAVSAGGRVFVNFPRWGGFHDLSVAEVKPGGLTPYPDSEWNSWTVDRPELPGDRFVCVQSVVVDADDTLWILDPASVGQSGVVAGGAKLVGVDLATDTVRQIIRFSAQAAPASSYLNDLRIDNVTRTAFITDSGLGALLVVDLESGETRRVLDGHPTLRADPALVPVIGGREWRLPDGQVPQVHADGIALDHEAGRLYLHALTGRRLWSLPTDVLRDPGTDDATLAERLRDHGDTVVTDGMLMAPEGSVLHTALELDAVVAVRPDGQQWTVVSDPLLAWPDSLALSPDGWLYVTTSRIHDSEAFGRQRTEPYRLLRFRVLNEGRASGD